MNIPILKFDYSNVSTTHFINFWSAYYVYAKSEYLYDDTINNATFSPEDIRKLYEWKNGMKLNGHVPKEASVNKVLSKLNIVNQLKSQFDMSVFNSNFKDISAIWKLFLLHIIQPSTFPIFDQHVYRAHFFIINNEIDEIKASNKFKETYYYNVYLPYYNSLIGNSSDLRKIDKALWSFGKFLKTTYAPKLTIERFEEQDDFLPRKSDQEIILNTKLQVLD